MWDLVPRDRTQVPYIASMESYPLDHQGSPYMQLLIHDLNKVVCSLPSLPTSRCRNVGAAVQWWELEALYWGWQTQHRKGPGPWLLGWTISPKLLTLRLFFFFFERLLFIYLFIYLFMAVLGLRFCARAFSSCGKRGPLFIAVRGPLTIAASLVAEHRLQMRRLSSCGSRA